MVDVFTAGPDLEHSIKASVVEFLSEVHGKNGGTCALLTSDGFGFILFEANIVFLRCNTNGRE